MNVSTHYLEQKESNKLWTELLKDKNFYGYEFLRNQEVMDIFVDFICPEVKFAICIQKKIVPRLSLQQKKALISNGYHLFLVSPRELVDDYDLTVEHLSKAFSDLVRFRCDL